MVGKILKTKEIYEALIQFSRLVHVAQQVYMVCIYYGRI